MLERAGRWEEAIGRAPGNSERYSAPDLVSQLPKIGYISSMKPTASLADKLDDDIGVTEPGYEAWKRAKVERGIAQAKNRAAMTPAEQVLDTLKLAR